VRLIHEALLLAVQGQPEAEFTLTDPVPAAALYDWLTGEML
jgi:hypothetical protein